MLEWRGKERRQHEETVEHHHRPPKRNREDHNAVHGNKMKIGPLVEFLTQFPDGWDVDFEYGKDAWGKPINGHNVHLEWVPGTGESDIPGDYRSFHFKEENDIYTLYHEYGLLPCEEKALRAKGWVPEGDNAEEDASIAVGETRYWRGHPVIATRVTEDNRVETVCLYLAKFGGPVLREIDANDFLALDPPPKIDMAEGLDLLSDLIYARTSRRLSRDHLWNHGRTGELSWVVSMAIDLHEDKHGEVVASDTFPK